MKIEIKVPSPGESISEVVIASWMVADGDMVSKDQEIAEIESDKATLPLVATVSGKVHITTEAGSTVAVGSVVCTIDSSVVATASQTDEVAPVQTVKEEVKPKVSETTETKAVQSTDSHVKTTPVAQKMMDEHHLSVEDVINGLRRISKSDVEAVISLPKQTEVSKSETTDAPKGRTRNLRTEKMSSLRKKLSERLVSVKNETAMLTTFNEVDMSAVMKLRESYQKPFVDKYGIKVGFMSFFIKAASVALMKFPEINASIDGDSIVYHDYVDIGIAVQSAKGLLVPILRNTEAMSFADIELKIKEFGEKGKANKIGLEDLTGGTFTITNGGTFGSLLSTPIINPPQSGILGMHNIVERPIALNGQVVIRPMMYIALSYDHRIIDGKSAVSFLVTIKDLIENPTKIYFNGGNAEAKMLGI